MGYKSMDENKKPCILVVDSNEDCPGKIMKDLKTDGHDVMVLICNTPESALTFLTVPKQPTPGKEQIEPIGIVLVDVATNSTPFVGRVREIKGCTCVAASDSGPVNWTKLLEEALKAQTA